ncbi:globin 1 [Lasius niger]|uniref:Globin 1 n=1 Tax=Lasius niger TaxID=67767 RepID=A0A0J7NM42_LASNI|nr:globin 1 [Lasius niger]
MTERQKRLVQNTWAIARKDEVSAGLAIMIALFKQYPEYQKQFKSFKDVPIDELPKNKRFQAHCVSIISTFGKLIELMYDPELMQASLTNVIEKHKTRGQTQEQFEEVSSSRYRGRTREANEKIAEKEKDPFAGIGPNGSDRADYSQGTGDEIAGKWVADPLLQMLQKKEEKT